MADVVADGISPRNQPISSLDNGHVDIEQPIETDDLEKLKPESEIPNIPTPTDHHNENILEDSEIEAQETISDEQKPLEASRSSYKNILEASVTSPAKNENIMLEAQNFLEASRTSDTKNEHIVVQSDELDLPEVKVTSNSLDSPSKPVADSPQLVETPQSSRQVDMSKIEVDTSAPIESVKVAVSKFGGIVDWKAHKIQTVERRKLIEEDLEKAHEEIPEYRKMAEAAEDAKERVLKELDSTKRLIEELKLSFEKAQTEEQQAKQDSELALLRVQEIEQGHEQGVASKAQLEVAKARHAAAVIELKLVNEEFKSLRRDYACLINERDLAVKKAKDAILASREVEKTVEELTIELISTKESLETAHAAHLKAEEKRIGAAMASEQDFLNWDNELKQADAEIIRLEQQVISSKELKSKLEIASSLLLDLKAELAVYMDSKLSLENELDIKNHIDIQEAIESKKKELEEIKINIEKGRDEVSFLNVAASSLKSELEKEKSELSRIKQREGIASVANTALESEIEKTNAEIAVILKREEEMKETMVDLPVKLHQAAQDADQSKSAAEIAREELRKAEEELEQAKAGASTMESRLLAAQKEMDAAMASEKLAVAAIKALEESEKNDDGNSPTSVAISLEEYYELSKKAHEAEERAAADVAEAMSRIDAAKESEMRSLEKLEELNQEMSSRKEVLRIAMENAEKAKEGKLSSEQELRKWRAELEQQRKVKESSNQSKVPIFTPIDRRQSMNYESSTDAESLADGDPKVLKKKKRSLFPRILMFLVKKRPSSSKSS